MTTPPGAGSWIFLDPAEVPERWRARAIPVAMIPLLDDERRSVLDGRPAVPAADHDEMRLLALVARALPIRAIARELGLGERATQKRLAGLRRRFGAGSTAELSTLLAAKGFRDLVQQDEPQVRRDRHGSQGTTSFKPHPAKHT